MPPPQQPPPQNSYLPGQPQAMPPKAPDMQPAYVEWQPQQPHPQVAVAPVDQQMGQMQPSQMTAENGEQQQWVSQTVSLPANSGPVPQTLIMTSPLTQQMQDLSISSTAVQHVQAEQTLTSMAPIMQPQAPVTMIIPNAKQVCLYSNSV